ncbi:MAG TPA: response regulator, partial [Thermoanaerobaculia bacterium]|nr:response regulator [Thermoanaerobaculia bacterium]
MPDLSKVLVVEDDSATQSLLRTIAQREGFEVLTADDGAQALVILARSTVDVILLDLLLPRVNGFEVLRHLRCTSPELLQRTIVISAASEATTRDCEDLPHVWCFRRKPMDILEVARDLVACAAQQPRKPSQAAEPRAMAQRRAE